MSTRATYTIGNQDFYIHHDGYPDYAWIYIKLAELYSKATGESIEDSFAIVNERAEKLDSLCDMGQEYHYTLKGNGSINVEALKSNWGGNYKSVDKLKEKSNGENYDRCYIKNLERILLQRLG